MPTKKEIYDEMCRVMSDYESKKHNTDEDIMVDMYATLVKIQNNWETVITAED